MALPETHRIDHRPSLILHFDTAWDKELLDYERDVQEGKRDPEPGRPVPPGKWEDHPWRRYVNGSSRGDERTITQYLKHHDGHDGPVRFRFRRIGDPDQWAEVRHLEETGRDYQSKKLALRLSLIGASGLELEGGKDDGSPLTKADLKLLRSKFGDLVFEEVATFARAVSRELTDAEKKF